LPMEWVCGIDEDGHLFVSSVSYTFFRFELTFAGPWLPVFLGLQVDKDLTICSSQVVRQRAEMTEGYQQAQQRPGAGDKDAEGDMLAGEGERSVFVSTLRASVPLQLSEERMQCLKDHDFVNEFLFAAPTPATYHERSFPGDVFWLDDGESSKFPSIFL
ncbi:MAG: hypothetical protein ACPIOQ_76460, partial [Promethearchaeia archaeon]